MAAARAAARRQAILSSRGNRLAKLTSSARGDDPGGVYANDDPPLPTLGGTNLENFVGDETVLPKATASASQSLKQHPSSNTSDAPPTDWASNQQQEFIRALMGNMPGQPGVDAQPPFVAGPNIDSASSPASEDPFSALLSTLGGAGGPFTTEAPPPARPRTFAQKTIPWLHLLSMLSVIIWFVIWREPETFAETWASRPEKTGDDGSKISGAGWEMSKDNDVWSRWAVLAQDPSVGGTGVPPVPAFFWAFISLQLALHSLRLVSQPEAYRPPMLLGLVMPYLPPPLPQTILTSLKYLQMCSMVLDDLAILLFGVGLVVFVSSNWMT